MESSVEALDVGVSNQCEGAWAASWRWEGVSVGDGQEEEGEGHGDEWGAAREALDRGKSVTWVVSTGRINAMQNEMNKDQYLLCSSYCSNNPQPPQLWASTY